MIDPIPERKELDLSERFDRGERNTNDPLERNAFDVYGRIQAGLAAHRTPEIDKTALAHKMSRELERSPGRQRRKRAGFIWPAFPKLAWISGFAVIVIGVIYGFMQWTGQFTVAKNPVANIQMAVLSESRFLPNPWLRSEIIYIEESMVDRIVTSDWKRRLQRGESVAMPGTAEAKLTLIDGSIVVCSPGAKMSIRFADKRVITLDKGMITVNAAHDDSEMIVETPLIDVVVTGTVFQVEVY